MILHLNKAGVLAIFDFVDMCDERACEVWFVCYIYTFHFYVWTPERFQKVVYFFEKWVGLVVGNILGG